MTKVLCNIYKSRRKEETYLFVSLKDDLSRVPDVLLETFGRPELVTKMLITPERKFAIADATKVLDSIEHPKKKWGRDWICSVSEIKTSECC
jgi:uncharacterized protein YcgL (UPF0745 family)